jgi:hypothetical protein
MVIHPRSSGRGILAFSRKWRYIQIMKEIVVEGAVRTAIGDFGGL